MDKKLMYQCKNDKCFYYQTERPKEAKINIYLKLISIKSRKIPNKEKERIRRNVRKSINS
jgi:hypothetical protein